MADRLVARSVALTLAALVCAAAVTQASAAPDKDAEARDAAVSAATSVLDAALAAKQAETTELQKSVRTTIDALAKFKKGAADDTRFATTYNTLISLGHFHGTKPNETYVGTVKTLRAANGTLRFSLPVGRGWESTQLGPGSGDQLWGTLTKTLRDGSTARIIKIWAYRWDTVYSDVGGENAKGLAEGALQYDRIGMTKITSRSQRVVMKSFNSVFSKAACYELTGIDEKLGSVHRRNYYVKGELTTFNFEIIEMREPKADATPFDKWQITSESQETDFIIDSMDDREPKKK